MAYDWRAAQSRLRTLVDLEAYALVSRVALEALQGQSTAVLRIVVDRWKGTTEAGGIFAARHAQAVTKWASPLGTMRIPVPDKPTRGNLVARVERVPTQAVPQSVKLQAEAIAQAATKDRPLSGRRQSSSKGASLGLGASCSLRNAEPPRGRNRALY